MDIFTYDRSFFKQDEIDEFESAIWTERYYGDADFELNVPATDEMLTKLSKGQLMGCVGSEEPMILETRNIKDDILKVTGTGLVPWLNNRFIRAGNDPTVRDWKFSKKPADALRHIVQQFCVGGPFLDGTTPIGIPAGILLVFPIPGLQAVNTDFSGVVVDFSIPYGPVYDALAQIAPAYEVGMKITLDGAYEDYYNLQFEAYKGKDRTSDQDVNPTIRFSEEMNTLTNVEDLESITDYRNYIFEFPSTPPAGYAMGPALADVSSASTGFDLRIHQAFADFDTTGLTDAQVYNILLQQVKTEWKNHKVVQLVDGEIVQSGQINYGEDYFMGDVIEVEGNTGVLQNARITEYIRSQDSAGERAYPGLTMIDE